MLTSIFWVDSVQLMLYHDEFLLPANSVKCIMAVQQGKGNRVVMHAANQLRDTLPNCFSLSNDSANDYRMVQMALISVA